MIESFSSTPSVKPHEDEVLPCPSHVRVQVISVMNFGGGPPFGNGPPFTNVPPYGYPPQFPGMIPPMTAVPGMPLGQPLPTVYPHGQGPLAGRAVERGANGLFEAPEPEGPELHGTSAGHKLVVVQSEYTTYDEDRSMCKWAGTDSVSMLLRRACVF